MKRGIYMIMMMVLYGICLHAQTELTWIRTKEGKMVAMPKRAVFDFNIPKLSYKSYTPSMRQVMDAKLKEYAPDMTPSLDERPMDMQILSEAYRPFFNEFAPMIRRVSPMAFDFNETSITQINDQFSFIVTGQQYTWPGMGGLTRVSPELVWQKEKWTLSGGAFAGRYFTPFNPTPDYMGGFNVMAAYEATDWLTLRGWGQYTFYSEKESKNPHMLMNPFYNHPGVGGAFEFKVNDGLKFGVGVNYEYNPVRGKMERQFLFHPGGKIGRISFGN